MRRGNKQQLQLALPPTKEALARVPVEASNRELVEALAELLISASRTRRGSSGRSGDDHEDHG
jgi:hypothetical protein